MRLVTINDKGVTRKMVAGARARPRPLRAIIRLIFSRRFPARPTSCALLIRPIAQPRHSRR